METLLAEIRKLGRVQCRLTEITDSLVELFIQLVHRINTRAERRVDKELVAEFRRVRNKEQVLFRMAEAAVDHPDERVREAFFPVSLPTLFCSPTSARRALARTNHPVAPWASGGQ